jgi:hypothetical protein
MSEMEERVARALCRAIGVPEDGLVAEDRNSLDDMKPAWVTQLPKATAAIAVMREPLRQALEAAKYPDASITTEFAFNDGIERAMDVIDAALAKKVIHDTRGF